MGRDIRLALRRLGATPLFTTFAILSLAVGVAITTAVYSIVDAVFLRGLGIHEPDRVAVIVTPYSGRLLTGTVSEPDFRDVQTAQTSFSHVAASATFVRRLALPSVTEMVIGESVSGSYFATLGVSAKLGRTIQPSDDAGGGRVVMLSDTLWRRRFASDPRIVGGTVAISGEPFEIIGVAPASFSGPRGWLVGTQFWIPLGTESRLKESPGTAAPRATARDDRRLTVFGRLATEVTIAAASAEMQTIAERLDESFPPRFRGKGVGATDRPWRAKTMAAISDDEDSAVRRFGMTLVALVGLVLVVFGLEPAIQLTRTLDVRGALAGGSAAGPQRSRRQRLLLRWQVAIAAGFFIIATMFVKYSIAEARHDSGIDLDRIGVAVLNFDTPEWNEPRARRIFDRVLDELRRHPSVEAASLSSGLPFGVPSALRLSISPLEQTGAARMDPQVVTTIAGAPSMFRTLGVEILRGRGFDDRDGPAAPRVVVLSEFTARQMFGTADVVGREMAVGQTRSPTATIVGVAADTDVGSIFADPRPLAYVPLTQHYQPLITVVARASGSVTNAVGAMREAIRRADPDVAIDTIGTGRSVLAGPFQVLRGLGMTAVGLGAITLLLAMAGLYGVQSHIIANRTRGIGVRMSLGGTAGQIKRMVLVDGYRPVLDGLIFGLSIGLVGRAIARAYLELDVAIVDPWMLVVTPIPLICAAFFACYLPARRAAAVDPNVALRSE